MLRTTGVAGRARACAALAATMVLGFAATGARVPSDWLQYTAIAKSRLDIGSNIEVSGNYAVTQPGGRLSLGTNLFHSSVPPDSFLAADQMEFTTGASANNVLVNSLQLNGTSEVRGTHHQAARPAAQHRGAGAAGRGHEPLRQRRGQRDDRALAEHDAARRAATATCWSTRTRRSS